MIWVEESMKSNYLEKLIQINFFKVSFSKIEKYKSNLIHFASQKTKVVSKPKYKN